MQVLRGALHHGNVKDLVEVLLLVLEGMSGSLSLNTKVSRWLES